MKKSLVFFAILAAVFSACTKKIYIPVEKIKEVRVTDTTYVTQIDTVVTVPDVSISDFIDVSDTLVLRAPYATATAWVDTDFNALKGRLVQGGKLPVQIVERERVVTKDSLVYQDKPYPVEVEKIVKTVPKFWRIFGILGIFSLIISVLLIIRKVWSIKIY